MVFNIRISVRVYFIFRRVREAASLMLNQINVFNCVDKLLNPLFTILPLLISTAYFTLAERKVLASVQRRVGPILVGVYGCLQPIADGIKLLSKEYVVPTNANKVTWHLSPYFSLWFSFLGWFVINNNIFSPISNLNYSLFFLIICSSFNLYWIFLAGWYGRSEYGVLGALRAIAQLLSYELVLSIALLPVVLFTSTLNLNYIEYTQVCSVWFIFPLLPCAVIYFICILVETNRIPFDLLEAEAELVGGYYTEYGGFWFASFFLSEYGNMLLMSGLFTKLFLGGGAGGLIWGIPLFLSDSLFYCKVLCLIFFIIFLRANLPRYRFDQLMLLSWKTFIPTTLSLFIFYLGVSLLCWGGGPIDIVWASESFIYLFNTASIA